MQKAHNQACPAEWLLLAENTTGIYEVGEGAMEDRPLRLLGRYSELRLTSCHVHCNAPRPATPNKSIVSFRLFLRLSS